MSTLTGLGATLIASYRHYAPKGAEGVVGDILLQTFGTYGADQAPVGAACL